VPRTRAPIADALRSTPPACQGRDAAMFPEADAARTRQGSPSHYYLAVGPARVTLMHHNFYLPHWVAADLYGHYAAYLATWARESPRSFPRAGVGPGAGMFSGYCTVTVRREDAPEWIQRFRAAAAECVDPVEREQWLRRQLATLSPGP
jgi:hypothetical protein